MNTVTMAPEVIARRVLLARGQRVMLDADLAELYGVSTKALNQAVKRNVARFPDDFMFRLSAEEVLALNRSQLVTGSQKHRDPRFAPCVFTEHGAMMLGNVLRSDRAIDVSLMVVRAFVQLREMLSSHRELAAKLAALEQEVGRHSEAIAGLIEVIRELTSTPAPKKRSIGFVSDADGSD